MLDRLGNGLKAVLPALARIGDRLDASVKARSAPAKSKTTTTAAKKKTKTATAKKKTRPVAAQESASEKKVASAPKKVRGRPFGPGPDPRRNGKGRGKGAALGDPQQIALAALLAHVTTITNGRRRRKPKLRAILDQQLALTSQGDPSALKSLATLLRAVNGFKQRPEPEPPTSKSTVHDLKALSRIIEDYNRRLLAADRTRQTEGRGGDDDRA